MGEKKRKDKIKNRAALVQKLVGVVKALTAAESERITAEREFAAFFNTRGPTIYEALLEDPLFSEAWKDPTFREECGVALQAAGPASVEEVELYKKIGHFYQIVGSRMRADASSIREAFTDEELLKILVECGVTEVELEKLPSILAQKQKQLN